MAVITAPVLGASITFLLVVPPILVVQIRRGAIPHRRWSFGVGAWASVLCLTLFGLTGGVLTVPDGFVATALDGLALVAGAAAIACFGYYRRATRRAGLT